MKRWTWRAGALAGLVGAIVLACAPSRDVAREQTAQPLPPGEALSPAARRIRADVIWLADDARGGRETGTPGYDAAAAYVERRMEETGLSPAVDGAWRQRIELATALDDQDAARFEILHPEGERVALRNLESFRIFPAAAAPAFRIEAPVVFAGFGVHAPSRGLDDLAGLDLDGKIVAYFSGAPATIEGTGERAHFGSSRVKLAEFARRGAVGAISLPTKASRERFPWAAVARVSGGPSMSWVGEDGAPFSSAPGIKGAATLRREAAQTLFEGAPTGFGALRAQADGGDSPRGFDLPARVAMAGASAQDRLWSDNVIGLIEGADPQLQDEYVILTAHLDHIGVDEALAAAGKDGLHNGAMDNAAGVAVMLEAARRLAADPPARSVLIAAVTAEEEGLLGSDYLARHPVVAPRAIVANVNLDMPVLLYSFTDLIAFGDAHSSLKTAAEATAREHGVALTPDPIPEQSIFTRSDHYSFVRQGVPALFLFPGFANGGREAFFEFLGTHYHEPSDDVSNPIRYEDGARFAAINETLARKIADARERPAWNEGDLFGELYGR